MRLATVLSRSTLVRHFPTSSFLFGQLASCDGLAGRFASTVASCPRLTTARFSTSSSPAIRRRRWKSTRSNNELSEVREYKLRQLFEEYDYNKNGSITADELKRVLSSAVPSAVLTPEQLQHMIDIADLDNNGSVQFDEFCCLFDDLDDTQINAKSLVEYWTSSIKDVDDPTLIFSWVWRKLQLTHGDEGLQFPREIMCLMGAPGSGKGTNTEFIMKKRGVVAPPIGISKILKSPAAIATMQKGGLVGDFEVLQALLNELLKEEYRQGALIDGFPRTRHQVAFLHMLHEKMMEYHKKYMHTEHARNFRLPAFRIVVLFVDEKESIRRQMNRARKAMEHNARVAETGEGQLIELRDTDVSLKAAKRRYETFKEQALESLASLKEYFPYHVINAQGTVEEVQHNIMEELRYQSSLELQHETYDAIRMIPTASDVTQTARQDLVQRLDEYQNDHKEIFENVLKAITEEFIPTIRMHALSGEAHIRTRNPIFTSALARGMLVDIFADRDFRVIAVVEPKEEDHDHGTYFRIKFERPTLYVHNRPLSSPTP